jgi:hypothetical protein
LRSISPSWMNSSPGIMLSSPQSFRGARKREPGISK